MIQAIFANTKPMTLDELDAVLRQFMSDQVKTESARIRREAEATKPVSKKEEAAIEEALKATTVSLDEHIRMRRAADDRVSRMMLEADELFRALDEESGVGQKHDGGKPDWSLVPFDAMEHAVRVLEHGARKYGPENWRDVEDAERRYWNAAMRHMLAHMEGEAHDEDSGLPHLAHAVCSLLFILSLEFDHA